MARRRSERGPLSRTEILEEALALAEESGLDALSLHKLGARLGVSAMSLYNHISDKDDLLDGMGDYILQSVPLRNPLDGSLEDALRTMAHDFRSAVIRHPKAAPLLLTRRLNAPVFLPVVEVGLTMLAGLGLDEKRQVSVMRAVIAFLIGTLMREVGTAPTVAADSATSTARSELALRESGLEHVAASASHLAVCDHEAEMEFGLELLITSIQSHIDTKVQRP